MNNFSLIYIKILFYTKILIKGINMVYNHMKIIYLHLFCNLLLQCNSYRLYINRYTNPYGKKYYDDLQKRKQQQEINNSPQNYTNNENFRRRYPLFNNYFEQELKRLNSRNVTIQNNAIVGNNTHDM